MASRARAGSKRSKKTTPTGVTSQPSLAGMVEEVVVGGGAVRFYVVGGAENEGDTPGVFLTQSEGVACSVSPHSSLLADLLQRMREPLTVLPIKPFPSAETDTPRPEPGQ